MYELRIRVSSDKPINIHYNHALQSNLYEYIGTENHDYPGVKVFTFSRIIPEEGEEFIFDKENKTIFIQNGYFVFRTLLKDIAERLSLGLKQKGFINIYGQKLFIKDIKMKKINIEEEQISLYTISPVSIKDKVTKKYLNPVSETETFKTAVKKGIINKAKRIGIDDTNIQVEILDISSINLIKYIPEAIVEAYNMTLRLSGSPQLINVAYCGGIGQKTGCGFGCLEII